MRRASPKQPQNLGGRPITIDDQDLSNNRNCWIGLLSYRWGSIGWSLLPTRVRTPEDVREALASIETMASAEQLLLQPFRRQTTIVATAASIRATRRKLDVVGTRLNQHIHRDNVSQIQLLGDRVRESKDAVKTAWASSDEHREPIRGEHVRRVRELAAFKKDLRALEHERAALDMMLMDQEASYAQHELCAFIRRGKYAHSPLTLARAMAGLPHVGAWQSYRRCGGADTLWPTIQFRIFKIIEKAWSDRRNRSGVALLERLQKRVRAIHTTIEGRPDHHVIAVQEHLSNNWRYLRQAVEATRIDTVPPASVPYLVFDRYLKLVAKSTSPKERVLASGERLNLPRVQRRSRNPH